MVTSILKRIIYGPKGEPYVINSKKYFFQIGSRPVRTKYINSDSDVVRNDVLQFKFVSEVLREDSVFWDIGAHYGMYSILAAAYSKGPERIFAFEPDTEAVSILYKNLKYNQLEERVKVFDTAVYSVPGEQEFDMQNGNSNSHLIIGEDKNIKGLVKKVNSTTLNILSQNLPIPHIIKIDTEGAELEIIKGGDILLSNRDVVFVCELHPFAWNDLQVNRWEEFVKIIYDQNRTITLLDNKKSKHDLPFYGTIVF